MIGTLVRCLVEARRPVWLDGVVLGEPRELTTTWSGGVLRWTVVRCRVGLTTLDVAIERLRTMDGRRLGRGSVNVHDDRSGPESRFRI